MENFAHNANPAAIPNCAAVHFPGRSSQSANAYGDQQNMAVNAISLPMLPRIHRDLRQDLLADFDWKFSKNCNAFGTAAATPVA